MLSFIKELHVTLAVLTAVLFIYRGVLMLAGSGRLHRKWLRITPHIVDTFLLASGLWMAIRYYSAFYYQPWLLVKLAAIVAYIVLGAIAIKRGRTKMIRILAFLGSLLILAYIFSVAVNKTPVPFP
ncbi:MAG: SirB2 family protein [Gammaproteobacteria bacterium]